MTDLPSGTVTLLFSDIEGSTVALSRLGAVWAEALDLYRSVCRRCWSRWDGAELGTEGDSFFVVFESALDAAKASVQVQSELGAEGWPGGEPVRARIGIHTGMPTRHGDGYVGIDVHRAARIASAAHGGQIVLSEAAAVLVKPDLGDVGSLMPLGKHELKDLPAPEVLYQLVPSGVDEQFPPLRAPGSAPALPTFVAPLVGREFELRRVASLLADSPVVVVTGPGGVGKTRLAVAAASDCVGQFAGAVHFVDATEAASEGDLWAAIASVLGCTMRSGPAKAVMAEVFGRRILLLLDNVEQVVGAAQVISTLASASTELHLLVTSRRPLGVPGEQDFAVGLLSAEAQSGDPRESEAVRLFGQYAAMANASFEVTEDNLADIVDICQHVDGLPLALELVASRVRMLDPSMLSARLQTSLDVSAGASRTQRHRTLREAINWSYDLLGSDHKHALASLSVFAGGVDIDACSAVMPPDIVDRHDVFDLVADLFDLSLVTVTPGATGQPEVGMLHTIRQFAIEQLTHLGDEDRTRAAHAEYYAGVADRLASPWYVRSDGPLQAHSDNLQAALQWLLDHCDAATPRGVARAASLLEALAQLRRSGNLGSRMLPWAEQIVHDAELADSPLPITVRVIAAQEAGLLGDFRRAREHVDVALSMANLIDVGERIHVLLTASWIALETADVERARELAERALALAEPTGSRGVIAACVNRLAHVEAVAGHQAAEIKLHERFRDLSVDEEDLCVVTHNLAWAMHVAGRTEEALREMTAIAADMAASSSLDRRIAFSEDLGAIVAAAGHAEAAATLLGVADALRDTVSLPRDPLQADAIGPYYDAARVHTPTNIWQDAYDRGRKLSLRDALKQTALLR